MDFFENGRPVQVQGFDYPAEAEADARRDVSDGAAVLAAALEFALDGESGTQIAARVVALALEAGWPSVQGLTLRAAARKWGVSPASISRATAELRRRRETASIPLSAQQGRGKRGANGAAVKHGEQW